MPLGVFRLCLTAIMYYAKGDKENMHLIFSSTI